MRYFTTYMIGDLKSALAEAFEIQERPTTNMKPWESIRLVC